MVSRKRQLVRNHIYLAASDTGSSVSGLGIRLSDLRDLLIASPVKQQLIWLDCCHGGGILNFQEGNPGDQGQVRDRCFIAASRDFESAYAIKGEQYSLLTQALLAGLQQPDSDSLKSTKLIDFLTDAWGGAPQTLIFHQSGSSIEILRDAIPPTPNTPHPTPDFCPYKGLEFFTEADAPYFAGRQALTERIQYYLRNQLVITFSYKPTKSTS